MDDIASDAEIAEARQKTYGGLDRDLYLDVGFFATWFGLAEVKLTTLLAKYTGSTDLEAFDILCRGMDARVKSERLRKALKRHGKIGPELSIRLSYFADEVTPLRNKLMHNAFAISEDDGPKRYFLSGIANLPWKELSMGEPKTSLKPITVRSLDLYAMGVWLSRFARDVVNVIEAEDQKGQRVIETIQPTSMVPKAFRQKHLQRADRAKPDRPPLEA